MSADRASPSVEAELVAKIQRCQSEAEAELYDTYAARVYYVALRQTRPPQDAEDVRAENSDVRSAIKRTIARLKPRERDLLRLYYCEELPRNEIARRTGIAEERVRLMKSRALKYFREIYTGLNATKKN
jgi:DNA-directed RNA polymerase specialized sigma24 family protein